MSEDYGDVLEQYDDAYEATQVEERQQYLPDGNFTAVKSCSTCVNGNSYCKYLQRTPDPGEGPCENYQEER